MIYGWRRTLGFTVHIPAEYSVRYRLDSRENETDPIAGGVRDLLGGILPSVHRSDQGLSAMILLLWGKEGEGNSFLPRFIHGHDGGDS